MVGSQDESVYIDHTTKWGPSFLREISTSEVNSPFYSYVLGCQAF